MLKYWKVLLLALFLFATTALAQTHSLPAGWSLVGNDNGTDVDPVSIFGNSISPTSISTSVTTVWTWDSSRSRWNFFAPSMTPSALSTYATSKGYGALSNIAKGEGFWVNASSNLTLNLSTTPPPAGFPITFNGIEMDTMSFSTVETYCVATLTYKNISTKPLSPFLYFDIIVNGITVNQAMFITSGLSPGATAQGVEYIFGRACGTFTLRFNTAASHVY